MFQAIKQRAADLRTITALCESAECHANAAGHPHPGAEHFILAALDLPDGTARAAFVGAGADPDLFRDAIARQYRDALAAAGCKPQALEQVQHAIPRQAGLYQARASGQSLMQQLAKRPRNAGAALVGADVIVLGAAADYGVAARAFQFMGIERHALIAAAREKLA